jgi:hypothetical protein
MLIPFGFGTGLQKQGQRKEQNFTKRGPGSPEKEPKQQAYATQGSPPKDVKTKVHLIISIYSSYSVFKDIRIRHNISISLNFFFILLFI